MRRRTQDNIPLIFFYEIFPCVFPHNFVSMFYVVISHLLTSLNDNCTDKWIVKLIVDLSIHMV